MNPFPSVTNEGLLHGRGFGHRPGLSPAAAGIDRCAGGAATTIVDSGPFAWSRNPLYAGMLVLSAGLALLAGSLWTLIALPLEWALLRWGAVLPEERYLTEKFGSAYTACSARVRRWL